MGLAVDINGVVKRYAGHVAVRDLSLQVPRGSVYGLLGPNGAGKTTTIRMILNIIAPDEGTIEVLGAASTIGGARPDRVPARRAWAVQEDAGPRDCSSSSPRSRACRRRTRIGESMTGWSVCRSRRPEKDWGNAKVDELSRGMQQKVQFIGDAAPRPGARDPRRAVQRARSDQRAGAQGHGGRAQARRATVIFSTHLMDTAERLCDAVCIIARGKKVLDGPIEEVRAEHGATHIALSLGGSSANGVGAVLNDPRLIARLDDSNRFFEIELTTGADPQMLLRRLMEAGARTRRPADLTDRHHADRPGLDHPHPRLDDPRHRHPRFGGPRGWLSGSARAARGGGRLAGVGLQGDPRVPAPGSC